MLGATRRLPKHKSTAVRRSAIYVLLFSTTAAGAQSRRRTQAFLMCGVNRYVIN